MTDGITVAKVLLPRILCPLRWTDIATPLSRSQTITQVKTLFPDFDSINFTHYTLNRCEDLHTAFLQKDRIRLLQLLTLSYYDSLIRLNHPKPETFPKAVKGYVTGGHVVKAMEGDLCWALVAVDLTVKDSNGGKHAQRAVMERRKDSRLPDTWKFALLENS